MGGESRETHGLTKNEGSRYDPTGAPGQIVAAAKPPSADADSGVDWYEHTPSRRSRGQPLGVAIVAGNPDTWSSEHDR